MAFEGTQSTKRIRDGCVNLIDCSGLWTADPSIIISKASASRTCFSCCSRCAIYRRKHRRARMMASCIPWTEATRLRVDGLTWCILLVSPFPCCSFRCDSVMVNTPFSDDHLEERRAANSDPMDSRSLELKFCSKLLLSAS